MADSRAEPTKATSVSVVIPSYKRHDAVLKAVKSALSQTVSPLEVIVCNDGPDGKKRELLDNLGDSRVVFVEAPRRRSASATRNYGICRSAGEWIALLDDDDVWVSTKLELQLAARDRAKSNNIILAGAEKVYRHDGSFHVRPSRAIPLGLPVDQVLFSDYGGTHTSTLFAPAGLFRKYPFDENIERHEDWKWLLQACQDAPLIVIPEVVCVRLLDVGEGLTRPGGFDFSRSWYDEHKSLMTREGSARFIAGVLSRKAAYDRKYVAVPWLVKELSKTSGIGSHHLLRLLAPWILSQAMRDWMKSNWRRNKKNNFTLE